MSSTTTIVDVPILKDPGIELNDVQKSSMERRRRAISPSFVPWILIIPALVLIAVFALYPLVRSIWFSFNSVSAFTGELSFIGLDNFKAVVQSDGFGATLGRTAIWVLGAVSFQFILGLGLALIINTKFPMRGVYRALIMIPWATPSVLVALMWKWILDPNSGIVNQALLAIGIIDKPIEFLSSPETALPSIIMIDVWQGIPLFAVMILAALQAVSKDLREAASIDGCGRIRSFIHVVWPVILPTILITFVLRLIWTSNYVDLIFILTGGGPGHASTTLALQSYLTTYKSVDFGQGAAYAVIQALILLAFVVLYFKLNKKAEERQ